MHMQSELTTRPFPPADRLRVILCVVVVLFSVAVAVVTRDLLLSEPDIWWHIKTGEWIWQQGRFPTTDPFSYTFAGQPWIAKEWLSQVLYAAAYAIGGWNALFLLATLAISLAVGLLYWDVSAAIKPSLAASVVLVCFLLTSSAFTIRPHLLTLPLLIVWTQELFKSSLNRRAPNYLLLLIIVVWANLHAAFTMGFVIAFFAFLDFLENDRLANKGELIKWLVFLVLCPAVTLVHPYGYQAMMMTLLVFRSTEGSIPVIEWQPFNAQQDFIYTAVLLGLMFATITSGFKLGMARSLLIVLFTYLFLKHMRYGFFLFPVITLVVAPAVAKQFPKLSTAHWRTQPLDPLEQRASNLFAPLAIGLAGLTVALVGLQSSLLRTAPPEQVAATAAINFAKSNGISISGNVFNSYNLGGPLIFNDIQTFIDGRTDQLFINGFQKPLATEPRNTETLSKLIEKYDLSWSILPPDDPFLPLLDSQPNWKRVYADKSAVIHQRQ